MYKPGSWFLLAIYLMQVIDLRLYLKCQSPAGVFKHFASKNQLPGLSVSGTFKNGLSSLLQSFTEYLETNLRNWEIYVLNETFYGWFCSIF